SHSAPQCALFFGRQSRDFHTFGRTTPLVFFFTLHTLDEQKMTPVILAIGVIITGFSALMAGSDDIVGDAFSQAFIEHKVLSDKEVFESPGPDILRILDDTAIELKYLLEAQMFHPRTRFLTANTSGTIHQELFVFLVFHQVFDDL